jgi:hypothetical protein
VHTLAARVFRVAFPANSISSNFPGQKYIKSCIEILPLRDAAVSPPRLFCLEGMGQGKGDRKTQGTIEAGAHLHQRHNRCVKEEKCL